MGKLYSLSLSVLPYLLFSFLFTSSLQLSAAEDIGCTDPAACNFDPGATLEGGCCQYGDQCMVIAVDDNITIQQGDPLNLNVLTNDIYTDNSTGIGPIVSFIESTDLCIGMDQEGNLFLQDIAGVDCCGEHILCYRLQYSDFCDIGKIKVNIVCEKPDCSFINLEDYSSADPIDPGEQGTGGGCINVCSDAITTVFVPFNPALSYSWVITGGVDSPGSNPAEVNIQWSSPGSGLITLTTDDGQGNIETIDVCVNILQSPEASFTSSGYACLGTGITFTNTSNFADTYSWDFGDGETSNLPNPTHSYTLPGTYVVTLCATRAIYDQQGVALCCCTDCYEMEVVVDELPGPPIYWVSTLCEGDSSCYWTVATGCTTYNWEVLDAYGNFVPFNGQGNDTICLTWPVGAGPFGIIRLNVEGCSPIDYCTEPTEVHVPIIPAVSEITGPTVVCTGDVDVYTMPKWFNTIYEWNVTGGVILAGDSTHSVTIQWNGVGSGHIHVDYHSEFLAGLPNHSGTDCYGVADLDVEIRNEFSLTNYGPNVVCVGSTTYIEASAFPDPNYIWMVNPLVPFSNPTPNSINIVWATAGTYVISATPADPNAYCNNQDQIIIRVVELEPATGIDGPLSVCPGDTRFYNAITASTGVGFTWTPTNGAVLSQSGTSVEIMWAAAGPYSLSLTQYQLNPPGCPSDPISITIEEKTILGSPMVIGDPACTNVVANYGLDTPQDPDATYNWVVSPSTAGSVIGQGNSSIQVQWNNDPYVFPGVTLTCTVTLCGNTYPYSLSLGLNAPIVPVITQIGTLCPGVTATLDAGPGFVDYSWTAGVPTNAQTTTISSAMTYGVTTEDINGCFATSYYTANNIPGPPAEISSGDVLTICITDPHPVTIVAQTYSGLEFEWFCNGVSQGPATPTSTFTHPFVGNPGTTNFTYTVLVTDTNTGCQKLSIYGITVTETDNCGGPGNCTPEPYSAVVNSNVLTPLCNQAGFSVTATNFTPVSWTFGDGNIGAGATPTHTYLSAGCYSISCTGLVPELGNPGSFCSVTVYGSVCIPLAADFDFDYISCGLVQFTDFSSYIAGPGNAIVAWNWEFGAGGVFGTSALQNPLFPFPTPGLHPVKLTVFNSNGCRAEITYNVNIGGIGTPTITALTPPFCVDQAINFSASAAGAVSYFWTFGDGASYTGSSPSHAYIMAGPYTVTVVATSSEGCQSSTSIPINVNPGIPPSVITSNPGLTICQGSTTQLCAPAGYTYQWSGGSTATSQCINVGAGTYAVTITDAVGCSLTLDAVTVEELPVPLAVVSGDLFICDAGCTILSANYGLGYSYKWLDDTGTPLFPAETGQDLEVCHPGLLPGYQVQVTDLYGCSSTSAIIVVQVGYTPVFSVDIAPDPCAGSPTTLTVNPIDPDVTYSWSNGQSGPSITVTQAGTYTVVGTHNISGCQGVSSAVVFPLPDLCIVPAGCYEACNPDTICGPFGMTAYQWNVNGNPIPGETNRCLIVTTSGNYSLTATNSYGCSSTSGPLILELINCDDPCSDTSVTASNLVNSDGTIDECCYSLSYNNGSVLPLLGLNIHTLDADLNYDIGTLSALLNVQSFTPSNISLGSSTLGGPIPTGVLNDFIDICLSNVTTSPQQIIVDWIDFENMVACSDTLYFNCPVEPDCLYLTNDSIYCENGQTFYEFTVCNPNDNPWSVGYISINALTPGGIVVTPPGIDITGSPILPGDCQTFIVELSGIGISGELFCFTLTGHEGDPTVIADSPCCSILEEHCILIPVCDPCESVGVEQVALANTVEGCCYDISLYNDYDPAYFDEIAICVLSPLTTFTIDNPFGSGWTTSGYDGVSASLIPGAVFGNFVPGGIFTLPRICIDAGVAPSQLIEIKWMAAGNVVCRDTVTVDCEPPCGYFYNESIICDAAGFWNIQTMIKNTADYDISEVVISFPSSSGLDIYNTSIPVSIPAFGVGGPINFNIGAPAMAGDSICFTVTLHEINADGIYLSCCNFTYCLVLPDCGFQGPCVCNDEFIAAVQAGFTWTANPFNPLEITFTFVQAGYFSDCDIANWRFFDGTPYQTSIGGASFTHVYPSAGDRNACVKMSRTADDGTKCSASFCAPISVGQVPAFFSLFPNPTEGRLMVSMGRKTELPVEVMIMDNTQRLIYSGIYAPEQAVSTMSIDLSQETKGVYFVHVRIGDEVHVEKLILF